MRCPECARENPEGFRFCGACRAELVPAPATAREERKVVTVLFADLVGFTSRAERMDPEDVRALLAPYHERLRSELERFGGTVEKFIGDAVMALFGAPVAHEDDPERAVRAALEIRDWVRDEDELQVRIAVTTGEALIALTARPEVGEGMASGDVVNTAARLQSAAPVNGILVGETTYLATRDAIDYREHASVEAKGKSKPIAVWEAVQARAGVGVDVLRDIKTPLVGRERELDAVRNALVRVRAERTPQLVTLVGVPGIGKSRLVYELMEVVEQDPELIRWRQGRSLPYGEGMSFWPIAEIVKAEAGLLESDLPGKARAKLRAAVEQIADGDVDWLEGHLRRVTGLDEEEASLGSDRRAEAFAAWRLYFESLAEVGPLVLVFEDLHWADEGTLDFVDHLVDWASGVPIFVVATARPELLERRPNWGGGKANALTLALAPLSETETAQLVSQLSERPLLDADRQQRLLDHAGGNPLYAEQFVRMVRERGDLSGDRLPESVQGIIAARLDGLTPDEKSVLQHASVIGKVFWSGAVALLSETDRSKVEELVHGLERKEFVQRARRSSIAGETEYAFRHILVRDVAYGQMPRGARAEKHRRAADWIESLGRRDEHAETVAHHLTTALDYAAAAGMETAQIELDARRALLRAGERAASLGALPAATAWYGRLLELTPPESAQLPQIRYRYVRTRIEEYDIDDALMEETVSGLLAAGDTSTAAEAEAALANIHWLRGNRDACFASIARAVELIGDEEASPAKAYVLAQASRFDMLAGNDERAIDLGRAALELGERFGLDEVCSRALDNIGCSRVNLGDAGGIDDLERSLAIGEAANSVEAWQAAGNLASMFFQLGRLDEAEQMLARRKATNERFGIEALSLWERGEDVEWCYLQGRWDEAERLSAEWLAGVEASVYYMEAPVRQYRSRILFARDDVDGAIAECKLMLERARGIQDPQILQPSLAWWACLAVGLEQPEDAAAAIDESLTRWGHTHIGYAFGALDLAWAARAIGRQSEVEGGFVSRAEANRWVRAALHVVRDELVAAVDVLAQIGSLPDLAHGQLRAAEKFVQEGRRAEADEQLSGTLAFYRSVGAARYVRESETLLAAAS